MKSNYLLPLGAALYSLFSIADPASCQAGTPTVAFSSPTNGQQVVAFSGMVGTAQAVTGTVQKVVFSIYDQSTGQWWNGTNFQASSASLSTTLSGTNWSPLPVVALPAPCCG